MEQDTPQAATAKIRYRFWLPFLACPLGVFLGRYAGKYTFAAFGAFMES